MQLSILVADDHPLFREALKLAIAKASPHAAVIEASSLAEALQCAAENPNLALVLLDLRMPDSQGFAGLAQLHAELPNAPILVVTGVDQANAPRRARQFGAVGFVAKSAPLDDIAARIADALNGVIPECGATDDDPEVRETAARISSLTPTQLKVLLGVLAGKLNKQIAFELDIAEATVKAHMTAVLRKLNVFNRTQAALAVRALELDAESALK